ncbi:GyrI-like domain-containing protein [Georgenia satyanarayanai]|uniref:GyrI-like domain-containing protein n=1 Tax=Georgenia satyanarayanai TaxID=860221 RepID=UPI0012654767|nr:GyrI-like domain-containing protein [Georgenia satyanarayanai]
MAEPTRESNKTDVKKALDSYQARRGEFRVLDIPDLRYLMVDGHGDPNTAPDFTAAVETLYPVAYAVKFVSKEQLRHDYVVPPLEGLWWADDMDAFTCSRDKSRWDWTLLLLVPSWVPAELVDATVEHVRTTKRPARIDDLRVASLREGTCVQTLHVGAFDDEGPVLERLHHEVLPARGLRPAGAHHEIYLSDMRRTAPERQRTILRQPVAPA